MTSVDIFKNEKNFVVFSAGQTIFEEGQSGDTMFAVKQGEVDIIYREKVLETVHEGGILGEMALVDHHPRSASAVARTDCQLVPINEERFKTLIHTTPFFALQVLRITVDRLRRMTHPEG